MYAGLPQKSLSNIAVPDPTFQKKLVRDLLLFLLKSSILGNFAGVGVRSAVRLDTLCSPRCPLAPLIREEGNR